MAKSKTGSKGGGESEWFAKNEKELIERAASEREKRLEEHRKQETKAEQERLKAAHWLKCPKCGHDMEAVLLEEIEIDRCVFCEGIYFDRGELDTLMLRKQENRFKFYRKLFGLK